MTAVAAVAAAVAAAAAAAGGGECSGGDGVRGGTYLDNLVPRVGKYIWTVKLAPGSPAVLAVLAVLPLRAASKQGNGPAGNLIATMAARRSGTRVRDRDKHRDQNVRPRSRSVSDLVTVTFHAFILLA